MVELWVVSRLLLVGGGWYTVWRKLVVLEQPPRTAMLTAFGTSIAHDSDYDCMESGRTDEVNYGC